MSKHGPYSWLMHCENVEQQTEITLNTSVTKSTKNSTLYHCDLLPKIWPCVIKTFYQILTLCHCDLLPTIWPCVIMTFYQKSDLCHCDLWEQLFCPWTGMHCNLGFDTIIHLTQIYEKEPVQYDRICHWQIQLYIK